MKLLRLIVSGFRLASQIVLLLLILTPAHGWGSEDKIVFVSNRNGTPEIYLVEGLNGRPIQLTRNRFASSPSISPDGTEVVFVSSAPNGISNIFKLHIATNRIENLTNTREFNAEYRYLDWSPNGRKILFIKVLPIPDPLNREKTVLCVMDLKTGDIRHILQPDIPTAILHPSWSPDSQHILYLQLREFQKVPGLFIPMLFITDDNGNNVVEVRRNDQEILTDLSAVAVPTWSPSRSQIAYFGFIPARHTRQIYNMNLDDERVTALTSGGLSPRVPLAWRPDGRKILFLAESPADQEVRVGDVCVMDPDGRNKINLTQSPERELRASWSPDGTHIAFSRSIGEGESSIFVMDANGQNQQRLTFEPARDLALHWSPDGNKIAFLSDRTGARRIYTMDTNGQNVRQITHWQRAFDGAPAWSPDGRWLAFGSGNDRSWGIYLVDPQGEKETLIVRSEVSEFTGLAWVSHPTWSPDSQHLIYVDPERDDDIGLMKIGVDGGMSTNFNIDGLSNWAHPLWSPDGNSLLFSAIKSGWQSREEQKTVLFLMNLNTSESRHYIMPVIAELVLKSDFSLLRSVWAPDGSQLMLSIGQTRIAVQGERKLYLIDIASETVRLWMDDATDADWVRPGFVYDVTPRGKRVSTWAELKIRQRS